MKKSNLFSVTVLSLISLFALTPVHAYLDVSPTNHDFGDVEVGTSISTYISISNNSFVGEYIIHVDLLSGSGDFSLINLPDFPIYLQPGSEIDIEVVFAPSTVGYFSATLTIENEQSIGVHIQGTGVSAQPSPSTIQGIINFIDASVVAGSLVGSGSGNSADGRLNALRNMLIQASYLLSAGNLEGACTQLNAALRRCNDFVQGSAQAELAQMISDLMNDLGC